MNLHIDSDLFNGKQGYETFKQILLDMLNKSAGNLIPIVHDNEILCYIYKPDNPLLKFDMKTNDLVEKIIVLLKNHVTTVDESLAGELCKLIPRISEFDANWITEEILIKLANYPQVGDALEDLPNEQYDKLEDDIYDVVAQWLKCTG